MISKERGSKTEEYSEPLQRNLCSDILPHSDHGLVREPFDPSKYTAGIAPYDLEKCEDVLEVPAYVTDIYQRLYNAEVRLQPVWQAVIGSSLTLLCFDLEDSHSPISIYG